MSERAPEPTPLVPRQALQERVSEAILTAAAHTFTVQGERATLADVAAAAGVGRAPGYRNINQRGRPPGGVARATVYRYFPNRRRLLEEVARRAAQNVHERLVRARVDEVSVEEGVTRAVRAFVDEGEGFVVLARERGHLESDEFDGLIGAPLRRLLDSGRSAGRIRADIAPDVLAESLVGMVAGVLAHSPLGRDDAVASIRAAFLEGALVPARTER